MINVEHKIEEWQVTAGDEMPESLLESDRPVVLRGFVAHWPLVAAAKKSHLEIQDLLISQYNGRPVHLMRGPAEIKGRLFYNEDLTGFNFSRENINLAEVFAELAKLNGAATSPTLYVGSTAIDSVFPELRKTNNLAFLHENALASIWMGNKSRISAHYDAPDNIACVVAGKRQFTLFPPEQVSNLYVGPIDFTPAGQPASLVDFHAPDYQKYPKFKVALKSAQQATLQEGDAIYIPANWWHHVESLCDFNVLINYWWRQVENYVGVPNDALLSALLAIRALPQSQRDAWKAIFDYYIFEENQHQHIPEHALGVLTKLDANTSRKIRAMLINQLNR